MQTVPASVQLGFAYAGASGIGYRVLRLDRSTVVAAFTTTGVVEAPANSGQFQVTGGHTAHDEGGYRVWGTSGTDILWSDIESASPTAQQIWEYASRTLTSFGTLIADIWSYVTRSLTTTAAETLAAIDGSVLNVTRAATYTATITGLTIPATWTAIYLTAKASQNQLDSQAAIRIRVSNPGVGTDGLLYLNGAAATAALASLVVSQVAGTVAITITDDATAQLSPGQNLTYDIKAITSAGTSTVLTGETLLVTSTPTRTI